MCALTLKYIVVYDDIVKCIGENLSNHDTWKGNWVVWLSSVNVETGRNYILNEKIEFVFNLKNNYQF